MGMIPFNPPWGPARVSDDVYSVASLSSLVGNVLPFLRAIPWKKNTLISGYRRLCTLGSIHLSLHNPPVFVRHNVAFVVTENSMLLFRYLSRAKLFHAKIITNRPSLHMFLVSLFVSKKQSRKRSSFFNCNFKFSFSDSITVSDNCIK